MAHPLDIAGRAAADDWTARAWRFVRAHWLDEHAADAREVFYAVHYHETTGAGPDTLREVVRCLLKAEAAIAARGARP